ncbi:MAG: NUDIX domain-containing protein [Halobacteriota archaeon]
MTRKSPALTVDAVIISDREVVLIKRQKEPFQDHWALPGGFVEYGETVDAAIRREVAEETGLCIELASLVGVYSDPHRDPRGHVVSIAFLAKINSGTLSGGSDASEARLWPLATLPALAFDHAHIINDALKLMGAPSRLA